VTLTAENTNDYRYLEENTDHIVDISVDGTMIRKLIS
jgi:hypothetical protein